MTDEKKFRLVGTATLGPKGQVVIPAEVRESMGIVPGDKLIALHVCKHDHNAIVFVTEDQAQHLVDKMAAQVTGLRDALENNK